MAEKLNIQGTSPLAGACWLGILLAPTPLLISYFYQLWDMEQYQYFPALFLAVGMLFFARWDRSLSLPSRWQAWCLIVVGALLTFVGALYWSPWMGCTAFVCFFGAFLITAQSVPESRWGLLHLWPASWMLVRLPLNFDYQLTSWLQTNTAKVSSHLLDYMNIVHRLTGNVFHLPKGQLFVEAACSGVQSLFSLLFCSFMMVAWLKRSPMLLPIYAVAAVFWAGVMNIVRVVAIAVAQERWSLDLAHGWMHEVLGYLCLAGAILLLLSTDRLLQIIFYPLPISSAFNAVESVWNRLFMGMAGVTVNVKKTVSARSPAHGLSRVVAVGMLAVIPVLLIPQLVFGYSAWTARPGILRTAAWETSASLLSDNIPELEVLEYSASDDTSNPALGQHSHLWVIRHNGLTSRVVVSQHSEVHDLCVCYAANGWVMQDRALKGELDESSGNPWDSIEAKFVNSETVFGYLQFSTLDSAARSVLLHSRSFADYLLARVDRGDDPWQFGFHGETINVQLWTMYETPLSSEQVDELRALHMKIRAVIRKAIAETKGKEA